MLSYDGSSSHSPRSSCWYILQFSLKTVAERVVKIVNLVTSQPLQCGSCYMSHVIGTDRTLLVLHTQVGWLLREKNVEASI